MSDDATTATISGLMISDGLTGIPNPSGFYGSGAID